MKAIVCVDENWGIGKDNKLLLSIPEDMKFFIEKTKNNIIICGRKTLFSFKNKNPLKNRLNIVFTSDKNLKLQYSDFDNIIFVHSKEELFVVLKNISNNFTNYKGCDIFVCGGDSVYGLLLEYCDEIFVTKVYKKFDADAFFLNLDNSKTYSVNYKSEIKSYEDVKYQFFTYSKNEAK